MAASYRLPLVLALIVSAAVVALWAFLGRPVAMPPSPLAAGEKLQCVSYAPFREGQSPFTKGLVIPESQIDEDFAQLAKITDCVRTYSVEMGLDKVPAMARKHGLTVLQGIWIGGETAKNKIEIDTGVRLAQQNPDVIKAVVVGNEVMLRGEMSAADISAVLRDVKSRVGAVKVTYADVWEFWSRAKSLAQDVDFMTIHILPYWEDLPVSAREAGPHVDAIRQHMAEEFPGKEILIGETGWPSAGRMREGALPSPADQALVMHDLMRLAKEKGYRVNVIEAFDQPWKRANEGTVGGHWGLIDAGTRLPKFHWGEGVTNHPNWIAHGVVGVVAVFAAFGAALWGARKRSSAVPTGDWLGVAVVALAGGATLGAAFSALPLESLGVLGWTRNGAFVLAAIASLLVIPAAIGAGTRLPSLSLALGGTSRAGATGLAIATSAVLVLAVLAIGEVAFELVFDSRYKDFPYFPLTPIAVAVAVLAILRRPDGKGTGLAETFIFFGLVLAGLYIPLNETLKNWQALWFGLICLTLAFTLWRVRRSA
ncbi:beta-1,6-glucan synthase [Azorhizobium oxalatiphilum]|uniref:Endo-1,3-beta-glucanase btgC n=1 Tax=Azorhizobium oxalatiphilum TaxID=980631 RepID=A0A917FJQ3_9HYPH|nr:beta-1,6-glucan synthase [Azorhizobium oxalatiphilum]GGF84063.1 beta-1,6-glucan synthase [Azorhizobium oxalatiphilum]